MSSFLEPIPDGETEAFWGGVAEGRFLLPWCNACGKPFWHPRAFCPRCWSEDVELRESEGRGTVYTSTVVRRGALPPFDEQLPYALAAADLDDGVRVFARVVDADSVAIGDRVRIALRDLGGGTVPVFVPEEA
jgi:uncharacterized OB-fold protein